MCVGGAAQTGTGTGTTPGNVLGVESERCGENLLFLLRFSFPLLSELYTDCSNVSTRRMFS